MSKSRVEKIASYEERIAQLVNQKKQETQKLKAEERKERTKRLCRRHGLLEKFMPDLAAITDEQYEAFIKKGINTSYGQKILAEIVSSTGATSTQQTAEKSQASTTAVKPKAETPPPNGTNSSTAEPPTAARSGA